MNIRIVSLDLIFRRAEVEVPFSPQLTFIHGQTGAGKSSIARLIDWCLGGDMDFTHALEDELISAALFLDIDDHAVRINRDREDKSHVRLSWVSDEDEEPHNEIVPFQSQGGKWDPGSPETLSDHLFVLAGTTPLRVPQSRKRDDSKLQRLSFRDFLAFCYLPQEKLDVSLFRFGDNVKARKSEDVMRALLGLVSEKQQRLQLESDVLLKQSNSLRDQAQEVTEFLDRLEIDDDTEIEQNLKDSRETLEALEAGLRSDGEALPSTHPNDDARKLSAKLEHDLVIQREAVSDIAARIDRDRRLRAELISAQMKVARSSVAVEILSGVQFGHCPQCGKDVRPASDRQHCGLCHQVLGGSDSILPADAAESDLQSRIDELASAIDRHQASQRKERRRLRDLETKKAAEDDALAELLQESESKRVAAVRENARKLAAARDLVSRFENASRLRSEVARLRRESKRFQHERDPIVKRLKAENDSLVEHEKTRQLIARAFKEALLAVQMPDVGSEDEVVILSDLQPRIQRASGGSPYGFKNLGSSGMKTLFQCCYALALHQVAAEEDLLLPRFLIIDSPTKNIDEQVDSEIFHGFFRYLYGLMEGPMRNVQVVLVDSKIEDPPDAIELTERKMVRDDPEFPRLVPYGPSDDAADWDAEEEA